MVCLRFSPLLLPTISVSFFKSFQRQASGEQSDNVRGFIDQAFRNEHPFAMAVPTRRTKLVVRCKNGMVFVTKGWVDLKQSP
jgi:hypothetical protein